MSHLTDLVCNETILSISASALLVCIALFANSSLFKRKIKKIEEENNDQLIKVVSEIDSLEEENEKLKSKNEKLSKLCLKNISNTKEELKNSREEIDQIDLELFNSLKKIIIRNDRYYVINEISDIISNISSINRPEALEFLFSILEDEGEGYDIKACILNRLHKLVSYESCQATLKRLVKIATKKEGSLICNKISHSVLKIKEKYKKYLEEKSLEIEKLQNELIENGNFEGSEEIIEIYSLFMNETSSCARGNFLDALAGLYEKNPSLVSSILKTQLTNEKTYIKIKALNILREKYYAAET